MQQIPAKARFVAVLAGSALVVAGLFLYRLWQPETQVRKHWENFRGSVEKRNWRAMEKFIAADYSDRLGHDKAAVLSQSSEVFRHFLDLQIIPEQERIEAAGDRGSVRAILRISGRGSGAVEMVQARVNGLQAPFEFEWRRKSSKPWDWQLTRTDNAGLHLQPFE